MADDIRKKAQEMLKRHEGQGNNEQPQAGNVPGNNRVHSGGGGGGVATTDPSATVGPMDPLPVNRRTGEEYPDIEEIRDKPTGKITVEEAGHLGGTTVRQLVNAGKEHLQEQGVDIRRVGQLQQGKMRARPEDRESVLAFFMINPERPFDFKEVAHYARISSNGAWAATRDLEAMGLLEVTQHPENGKKAHVFKEREESQEQGDAEESIEALIEREEREFAEKYKDDPNVNRVE